MQTFHTNIQPQPHGEHPQHYFIEIKFDHSIAYGFMTDLSDLSHRKVYYPSEDVFYEILQRDLTHTPCDEHNSLVFVHGWNGEYPPRLSGYINSFDKNYVAKDTLKRTISIIWHTRGLGYSSSRKKVDGYAGTIALHFNKLMDFMNSRGSYSFQTNNNHLLCYSMGNYFFQNIFQRVDTEKPIFNQIILAAPDLDCDVFERGKELDSLHHIAQKVTVLQHRNDRLLGISKLMLGRNRLGRNGLKTNSVPPNIQILDVTNVRQTEGWKDKFMHHLYFYRSPQVVNQIRDIFTNKMGSLVF